MDNQKLTELILNKYSDKYDVEKVEAFVIPKINDMTPVIRESLEKQLQGSQPDEISLLGYSVASLQKDHGMNGVAAHLTLDWICREPQKAVESLEKGHDTIF